MKVLLIASLSLLAFNVFSADESLSEMKANANSNISKRMGVLSDSRNCINDAGTLDAFQACRHEESMGMDDKAQRMEESSGMKKNMDKAKDMMKSKKSY